MLRPHRGRGVALPFAQVSYKAGPENASAIEAHADHNCDTGSLGQALSITAGMAACKRGERYAIVMGDGEMQEGQNYEALMTIKHHKLTNLTIFVDINGFQSDNQCDDIMASWTGPRQQQYTS